MASPRITAEQRALFDRSLREGNAITVSARRAQVSVGWAHKYIKAQRQRGIDPVAQFKIKPLPLGWSKLNENAKRGWDDFPYFRLRYMGHPSEPWEVEAAETIVTALATEHREFIVESVAPGVGKTTMLHDVAAWATVRDRSIRGVFGSKNASNARRMMRRLRRTLERTSLVRARPEDLARGMAFDGVASLAGDYGLFRPVQSKYIEKDVWNNDEFVVVQDDDTPIDEKESTWTAFGIKSDILSMRYNLMLCDDMDDATTIGTMDQLETQRKKWDSEVETRLEPRGVIALVQQSLDPQDLARYNLAKKLPLDPESYDDIDDEEAAAVAADTPSMYQHIIYKAHDDTKCQGKLTHKADAPAWPVGCLLSPKRLPWRDLYRIKMTKPRTFAVEYQQEEIDPKQTLVRKAWIYGGTDIDEETGMRFQAPGCVDNTRGICDLPEDMVGPFYSIATVDPSPTKMWAIQWWIFAPNAGNQVFLMDTMRSAMGGNELLDYDPNARTWYGVMQDWQKRSVELGHAIQHWIVEVNAAQKFLLQYRWNEMWRAAWGVNITAHTTGINKLDPKMGVDIVRDWFKYGRIRLPFAGPAKFTSMRLIDEVCRYRFDGSNGTDDQVMACWFLFANLPALSVPPSIDEYQSRPSYVASLDARRYLTAVT